MINLEGKQLDNLCWDWKEEFDDVPVYVSDFETTTDPDDCRVWAWASCQVGCPENIVYGNSIESFMEWCEMVEGSKVYFHNLKFDGKFICSHILDDGWEWVADKADADAGKFTTLISDMSQWYSMKLWFGGGTVEFLDSLKVIPLPVSAIPKAFGLEDAKLTLDYRAKREPGHVLTQAEIDYITEDVVIVAKALHIMHGMGMTRMTAGSNAFADYKKVIGGKRRFRDWFPEPQYDADLRAAGCYKGGFTAVNPRFKGKALGEGSSYDVNSLYPSVMASAHGEVLPYGEPVTYEGKYVFDPAYPLYIQFIEVAFHVKEDHIPSLQLKGNMMFAPTEYVTDSKGYQTLCLTSVDLELMFEQYEIEDIRYIRGYKFKGSTLLFRDYVEKWTEIKIKAGHEGNQGMRTIAKLELNSLYGKLATNPVKQSRRPVLEDGVLKFPLLPEEYAEAQYLPAGAFITAYARAFTIRASQRNYDRWVYSDTDSCYLLGTDPPEGMKVDEFELGAWKREHVFTRIKALRAKTYVFDDVDDGLIIHCAGMPAKCHGQVTFEGFEPGASFTGKLKPRDVSGGVVLEDTTFTIAKEMNG